MDVQLPAHIFLLLSNKSEVVPALNAQLASSSVYKEMGGLQVDSTATIGQSAAVSLLTRTSLHEHFSCSAPIIQIDAANWLYGQSVDEDIFQQANNVYI